MPRTVILAASRRPVCCTESGRGEQRRLAKLGHRMRVHVPYGDQCYEYLMRRLAERPANLMFAARAVAGRS